MADASDSKSDEGDFVWVQVPSPAWTNGVVGKRQLLLRVGLRDFLKQANF